MNKVCISCQKELEISNFSFRKDLQNYRNTCKECRRKCHNSWERRNTHRKRKYEALNKDAIIKRRKIYYEKNRERLIKQNSDYVKAKRKVNPLFRMESNLRRRLSLAIVACGKNKSHGTQKLLGCSWQELKIYIEGQFQVGMTWDNYGEWHIDHIRPCSSFDLTNQEEQSKCFHYTNLQPLWAKDNLIKGARHGTGN